MASLPPDMHRHGYSHAVAVMTGLTLWIGSFVLLWMLSRYLIGDLLMSLVVAGLGLATLSPMFGVMSSPPGGSHGNG